MSQCLFLLACLLGQTEENSESAALELFKQEATEYAIRLEDRAGTKLSLDPKPVLHWSNPARTAEDGAVFVWLKDGRPEVIGTIFTYKLQTVRRKHELHSLSESAFVAEFKGKVAWKPRRPGVEFQPIPDSPAPAENPRQRLVQMKAMTRDFSANMKSLEGDVSELRLMTQPLYRYEPKRDDVLDGAIFSYALGTDPEVLLLIEARKSSGNWRWEFSAARFNFYELTLSRNGQTMWHVDSDVAQATINMADPKHIGKVYTSFHVN